MSNQQPLRFVNLQKPGQKYELEEHKAVRRHVRRAIVREKKSRDINQNIRILTPSDWTTRKTKKRIKTLEAPCVRGSSRKERLVGLPEEWKDQSSMFHTIEFNCNDKITPNPRCFHPFTVSAAKLVDLPEWRLDQLFKSDAFRVVGEPCFDTAQIDANRSLDIVFPGSLADPAFMHTLVCSMIQIQHDQPPTLEMLNLERSTIRILNDALANCSSSPSVALIGAIMILTASAYRSGNQVLHETHFNGLNHALKLISSDISCSLTSAASRAVFWLDLFSSVLMDSKRRFSHHVLPSQPAWHRSTFPSSDVSPTSYLPTGFLKHRSVIPDDLLDCLEDIAELQSKMADPIHRKDFMLLDDMQASVESRLSFQGRACRGFGPIAEMVRLSAFICCYCSWMDTWNCNLIPAKVAKKLLVLIEKSLQRRDEVGVQIWRNRTDLLLWLLFVVASVAQDGKWYAVGLKEQCADMLRKTAQWASSWEFMGLASQRSLKANLEDFICCGDWLDKRMGMREWFTLEVLLDAKVSCHNKTQEDETASTPMPDIATKA